MLILHGSRQASEAAAAAASASASSSASPTPTSTTVACKTAAPTTVAVTFNEHVTTEFGETIKMAGNTSTLRNWSAENGLTLDADAYTTTDHLWRITLPLAPGQAIEYKYVKFDLKQQVIWESDPRHVIVIPACPEQDTISRNDTWQF